MDARRQLNELITAASLPPVESTRELAGGFENQLLVGVLRDGRSVLLRQRPEPASNPGPRARFLAVNEVGAPRLYAADDTGAVLVEFVPGETLAAVARRGELGDRNGTWSARRIDGSMLCDSRPRFAWTSAQTAWS